jgi:hypothetical protein
MISDFQIQRAMDVIGCTVVDCATGEKLDDESACLNSLGELAGFFAKLEGKFS